MAKQLQREFSEAWKKPFRDKGLIECRHCHATGMIMTEEIADALDLSNDGKRELSFEETFCPHCNGYGWVKPAAGAL